MGVTFPNPTLDRWPLLKTELGDRYHRLMGGAVLT
jgi:hypothetical protein